MKFKGNIIITDPSYIIRSEHHDTNPITENDWDSCDYGDKMEVLGIKTYLTRNTESSNWSCSTYEKDTHKKLGSFCADTRLVSVFLLDEVLAYNPNFDYHIKRPWTTTLIENFDGEIKIEVVNIKYEDKETGEIMDEEARIIGKGNINFYTTQTEV